MIAFRRKRVRDYHHPYKKYQLYAAGGLLGLIAVILIIALVSNVRTHHRLDESRELMAASIQSNINAALRSYDGIDLRSADLTGEILPAMREYFYAADAMNRVLVEMFGDDYSVLDREMYSEFQTVMSNYDKFLSAGQSTDSAKQELAGFMSQMQKVLAMRFGSDGVLLPKTAMAETVAP